MNLKLSRTVNHGPNFSEFRMALKSDIQFNIMILENLYKKHLQFLPSIFEPELGGHGHEPICREHPTPPFNA